MKKKKNEAMIKHIRSKGVRGWVIARGSTWYGPYATRDDAEIALTRRDEWGYPVVGQIVEV